jgi:hypothetical protein
LGPIWAIAAVSGRRAARCAGEAPKLRKTQVLLFAQAVPGRPGELRLVAPDAIIPATPEVEATTRSILTALVAPDAPPTITRLREALHVSGNPWAKAKRSFSSPRRTGAGFHLDPAPPG